MADEVAPFTAVLDTNIFIRLALGRSLYAQRARQAWLDGLFVVASSISILSEVERVLHYPEVRDDYHLSDDDLARFLQLIRDSVFLTDDLYEVDRVVADPTDNKFLACALESGADYLISEDHHLREIKHYHGTQIIGFDQLSSLLAE